MKSITVHIPALLEKIQEMSNGQMENVKLTISDKVSDQDIAYPPYLHLEAYDKDGFAEDYESIDAFMFFVPCAQSAAQ